MINKNSYIHITEYIQSQRLGVNIIFVLANELLMIIVIAFDCIELISSLIHLYFIHERMSLRRAKKKDEYYLFSFKI